MIGFIGNTGDAFTTSPHLHFEVHPRQLRRLGYDGAVDPTRYLDGWTHLAHVEVPQPVHPPLPRQPALRQEARYVFRELLAARHLTSRAPAVSDRPRIHIPPGANGLPPAALPATQSASRPVDTARGGSSSGTTVALLAALASLVTFGSVVLVPAPQLRGGRLRLRAPALLELVRSRRRNRSA